MKKIFLVCVFITNLAFADNVNSIIEFFSFSCPHCYNAEQKIQSLVRGNNAVKYIPIVLAQNQQQLVLSAIYTACQLKGKGWEFRTEYFKAVFQQGYQADNPTTIGYVINKIGLDPKEIANLALSDTVKAKLNFDKQMTERYQVHATPTFVINGTNIVDGENALSQLSTN